jgi:hypothetical protein
VAKPAVPRDGSQEYLWWSQGARDNQEARNEGMGPRARELRDALEAFAQGYGQTASGEDLLTGLMKIYCPGRLRRRFR